MFYSLSGGALDAVVEVEVRGSVCFNFVSLMGIFLI